MDPIQQSRLLNDVREAIGSIIKFKDSQIAVLKRIEAQLSKQDSIESKINLKKSVSQGIRWTPDDYTTDIAANVTAPQSMFAGPKNRFANTSSNNPRRVFPPSESVKSQSTFRSPGQSPVTSRARSQKPIKRSLSQQLSLLSRTSLKLFNDVDVVQPLHEGGFAQHFISQSPSHEPNIFFNNAETSHSSSNSLDIVIEGSVTSLEGNVSGTSSLSKSSIHGDSNPEKNNDHSQISISNHDNTSPILFIMDASDTSSTSLQPDVTLEFFSSTPKSLLNRNLDVTDSKDFSTMSNQLLQPGEGRSQNGNALRRGRSGSIFHERREALKVLRRSSTESLKQVPLPTEHNENRNESDNFQRDPKASKSISGKLQPDQEPMGISKSKTVRSTKPNEKNSFLSDAVLLIFLLPAFDSKGRIVDLFHFEKAEIDNVRFSRNGLHPRSVFNTVWDLVVIGMFLVFTWLIPFFISFYDAPVNQFPLFSIVMTVLFALESITSVLTPQPKATNVLYSFREYESLRPTLSAWIQEWMGVPIIFEILTVVPFEVIFVRWEYSPLLWLIRLARLAIRIPKLSSQCGILIRWKFQIDELCGFGISKITPIAIGMIYFLHINACTINYFAKATGYVGWKDLWLGFDEDDVFGLYAYTLYKAVGSMFPAAFDPQTAEEQFISSAYCVVAAVIYAAFLGAISSATMTINPSGRLFTQKMEQLVDYVKWKNLSVETEQKLFTYYETKYRGKFFEEESLLSEMNESLRAEISLQNTRMLLERVPFLRRDVGDGRDEIFLGRLAMALRPQYYVSGDYITKQGDSGHDMFFILSGKVDVFVGDRRVVSLYDGAYIGEVALITKVLRTATVQAVVPSVMYRLTYMDFHEILDEFADMKTRIDELAKEMENRLQVTAKDPKKEPQ